MTGGLLSRQPTGRALLLGGVALVVFALRYAEPILDGDLFFHLAYAEQMLARRTAILDHTLYSWTPTDNVTIYLNWLAQLVLLGAWSAGGPFGMALLRYLVVAAVVGLVLALAQRLGLLRTPLAALLAIGLTVLVYAGSLAKPDMFSVLAFTAVVVAYVVGRLQAMAGRRPRAFFFVPLTLLVWVNFHGGFVLAAPFLALTAAGELLLLVLGARAALGRAAVGWLWGAWALCLPMLAANPYGLAYPLQLVDTVLVANRDPDAVGWNLAYRSILATADRFWLWALAAMALLVALVGVAALRRSGSRTLQALPLALGALGCLPLYLGFVRATWLLPVTVACLLLLLANLAGPARRGAPRATSALVAGIGVTLAGLIASSQPWYGWRGFGIGDVNPVLEAEFLATQPLGPNLYNVFDSGAYLFWRLWPTYRVMTDSRSFPYLSWFEEQVAFTSGRDVDAFMARHPADTAVIDVAKVDLWYAFLQRPDWPLAFYGRTAAVFVRRDRLAALPPLPPPDPARFRTLRSAQSALGVFEFATFVGDYPAAAVALERLEAAPRLARDAAGLARARAYREAIRAIAGDDAAAALTAFDRALADRPVSDRDRVVVTLLTALTEGDPAALDPRGREQIRTALARLIPPGFD